MRRLCWIALLSVTWAHAQEPAPDEAPPGSPPVVETIPVAAEEEPAPPQGEATRLDTINVTASKHLKSQRDLPGSVAAVRGADLEKMRAQGLSDYLKLVPGVALADYGTDRQIPVIRGIAVGTDQNQFTAYTTGIFLEEMPFNDLFLPITIPDLNPFDLERVEVLKGPQGTLFGASALAGAIRYIVQKPNLALWQAKFSSTLSMNEHSESPSLVNAAALNAPIGDSAALRLVGVVRDEAGLYDSLPSGDNPDTPQREGNRRRQKDIDSLDQVTGRALLRWDVGDTLRLQALVFGQETERDDDGSADRPDDFARDDVPFASPATSRFQGGNFSASNDFSWGTLLYSGSLTDKRFKSVSHVESALPEQLGNQQDLAWYNFYKARIEGTAHELRVSSLAASGDWEWLAGVARFDYRQEFFQFSPLPGDADSGYYTHPPEDRGDVPEADQFTQWLYATVDADAAESALFGEATRRLGEHWEATLGARLFKTEMTADTLFRGAQITALSPSHDPTSPGPPEARQRFELEEEGVNPKASLRYLHDANIQAYALAARGFQFGGVQINPPLANIEQEAEARGFAYGPYKSSELWNYELGVRTEWLDRRLRFDLTAFYLDWKDLQLTILVPINPLPVEPVPGSSLPFDLIVNVGAAHAQGLEAAFEVIPFTGAKVTSAAAWIDARTDEPFDHENAEGPVPAGTRLPSTPRFQWSNVLAYENTLPWFEQWYGEIALSHVHVGLAPNDVRPVRQVGGYDTIDLRASLVRPGIAWLPEIGLGVTNVTDAREVTSYTGQGDPVNFYYLLRPRTTVLNLSWSI
jgi:iron complex outermembrane recepter protein